jgi:nitrous oxidase accessory protein
LERKYDISCRRGIVSALLVVLLLLCTAQLAAAGIIQAGRDVQSAIDSAQPGDTVVVVGGEANSFVVDRPLTIVGQGSPAISAALQKPAIKVLSDGVIVTGFRIRGVGKDSSAKFNYYMQNPSAAANAGLDDANSAIVVKGNNVFIKNCSVFGAQVGISADNVRGLTIQNTSMVGCDIGASILQSSEIQISACRLADCNKYGLDLEGSFDIEIYNNNIVNNTNGGILLKESEGGNVSYNLLSQNTFGLALWTASYCQVRANRADHNQYGILVTDSSNHNNITDNVAKDNSHSDIVTGFGIGISLQENSSYNLLARNRATGNFNGLELSRGCQYNAVYDNNASDNRHGIRLNENRNNLIFGNNFYRNDINAYENQSLNIWNASIGNYYSDYRGRDEDGDGIGEEPYSLPGPQSQSFDYHPLLQPFRGGESDYAAIRAEVERYAIFPPALDSLPTTTVKEGVVVISRKVPSSPPQWSDSALHDSFDPSAPPFQKEIAL